VSRGGSRDQLDSVVVDAARSALRSVRAAARLASPAARERIAELARAAWDEIEGLVDSGPSRWDHALDLHAEVIDREREAAGR
jgi:hypothetical protein